MHEFKQFIIMYFFEHGLRQYVTYAHDEKEAISKFRADKKGKRIFSIEEH